MSTKEPPQEEVSTTFVRPPKKTNWQLIAIRSGIAAVVTVDRKSVV